MHMSGARWGEGEGIMVCQDGRKGVRVKREWVCVRIVMSLCTGPVQ